MVHYLMVAFYGAVQGTFVQAQALRLTQPSGCSGGSQDPFSVVLHKFLPSYALQVNILSVVLARVSPPGVWLSRLGRSESRF